VSDAGQEPGAERPKPRGEAAWKAHLQAITERNDRARAAGKRERKEREEREAAQRAVDEMRLDAELTRRFEARGGG
jgi:hypothetical protein